MTEPAYPVDHSGRIDAMLNFDAKSYPGEVAFLAAWHDLGTFIAAHPVLQTASMRRVELYIGNDSGD